MQIDLIHHFGRQSRVKLRLIKTTVLKSANKPHQKVFKTYVSKIKPFSVKFLTDIDALTARFLLAWRASLVSGRSGVHT